MQPLTFYKAIADNNRLKAMLLLCQLPELCVCDLMQALDEPQPKVSRHLALLKKAGLLHDRKQGLWVFYRLHPALPAWAEAVLRQTLAHNPAVIRENIARLADGATTNCC